MGSSACNTGTRCVTSGTRRLRCVMRLWWEGWVDSHSGMVGSPVSCSANSICCQNTGPDLTSAHAQQKKGGWQTERQLLRSISKQCFHMQPSKPNRNSFLQEILNGIHAAVQPGCLLSNYRGIRELDRYLDIERDCQGTWEKTSTEQQNRKQVNYVLVCLSN